MGKEKSERIQTSFLNSAEKKALVWLAGRQPKWMTSDILTYIGVFGSVLFAVGCFLANSNVFYLWMASLGLVIHWYGDSMDGTLARVRNTQRPVYGFFIDHSLDAITNCIKCIGAGLSPMFNLEVALVVLAGYLVLSIYTYSIYTYIGMILKDEFRLTYGKLGPTEFRLLLILMCILYMYTPWSQYTYEIGGMQFGLFDILGGIITAILYLIYLIQFVKDRRYFAEKDPFKPYSS